MSKPLDHSARLVAPGTTAKLQDTLAYPPRGMDADRAAAYVCLSKSKFLELVDAKEAPQPVNLGGCPRWDRRALDEWFDGLGGYTKRPSKQKTITELLEEGLGSRSAQVRKQL
jgi:predicted DNA-binding transcriptional regulator AlpA